MSNKTKKLFILLGVSITLAGPCAPSSLCNDEMADLLMERLKKEEMIKTLKKELKQLAQEIEQEKEEKGKEEEEQIEAMLEAVIGNWIASESAKRDKEINRLVEQEWEWLTEDGPSIHYDYYLRSYKYQNISKDIAKTGLAKSKYSHKCTLKLTEDLYVERLPLINMPRSKYYYTFSAPIEIVIEYYKDSRKWSIVSIERGQGALIKGWPKEMTDKISKTFLVW